MEERLPQFLGMFGGDIPEMPVIEDFDLLVCISDASNADGADYYPRVYSQTPIHRHLGMLEQARNYLNRGGR